MTYSIDDFWKSTFQSVERQYGMENLLPGWNIDCKEKQSYVEAGLSIREGFENLKQPVWLIAAAGAVGKTTLAKQICAITGAVYLDLAQAETVAGNYLVGGMVNNNIYSAWEAGKTTVLIDALDEARLRVTHSSFEDFLKDVARLAKKGSVPLVLLGRIGIIDDAWTVLNDQGLTPPIFDIGRFDDEQARKFVFSRLRELLGESGREGYFERYNASYETAISDILANLQGVSEKDQDDFVGYAPVLDAVAIELSSITNPAQSQEITKVFEVDFLNKISQNILEREAIKLRDQLPNTCHNSQLDKLYSPFEQLDRLACKLFGLERPSIALDLPSDLMQSYEDAVESLMSQHPFLKDGNRGASSSVFGACIVTHALKSDKNDMQMAAEVYANRMPPNPFLFGFYKPIGECVPAKYIGLLYESVLAKADQGDKIRLFIEATQDDNFAEVEISSSRSGSEQFSFDFRISKDDTIRFGRTVSGVVIDADQMGVELGASGQLELIAPISVNAQTLILQCEEMIVKKDNHPLQQDEDEDNKAVILEASLMDAGVSLKPPTIHSNVELKVNWEDSNKFPWTSFNFGGSKEENLAITDGLRALRRLIMSFRSHSKGQLARCRGKIEHARMMKGNTGETVRKKLLDDKILKIEGSMYILDPNELGEKVGISFLDAQLKRYSQKTKVYIEELLIPREP